LIQLDLLEILKKDPNFSIKELDKKLTYVSKNLKEDDLKLKQLEVK
jgi:hypothetical protein